MDRLVLLVFALVAQVGCQAPNSGYGLFAPQQTRVPPPHTGVIGDGGDYYSAPAPNTGAYTAPVRPLTHVPGEQVTNVGPWRYWESANGERRNDLRTNIQDANRENERLAVGPPRYAQQPPNETPERLTSTTSAAESRSPVPLATRRQPSDGLRKNDRLAWQSPSLPTYTSTPSYVSSSYASNSYTPPPSYSEFVENDVPVGSSYRAPRYLPQTGPVTPITAPVRVRGFANSYGRQSIGIPPELAEYQNNGVRQASATWRARYDDVRR